MKRRSRIKTKFSVTRHPFIRTARRLVLRLNRHGRILPVSSVRTQMKLYLPVEVPKVTTSQFRVPRSGTGTKETTSSLLR